MPWYAVTVQRVEYQRADVEVEADTPEEAHEIALTETTSDEFVTVNAEERVDGVKLIPQEEYANEEESP